MKPPKAVHDLVTPFLTLLGEKIREQTFTALEVEEALDWDRGHIRQLTAGQKRLRVDEMLSILGAIGAEPRAFFAELYGTSQSAEEPRAEAEYAKLGAQIDGLVNLLVKKKAVTASELARAVAAHGDKDSPPAIDQSAAKAPEPPKAQAERKESSNPVTNK